MLKYELNSAPNVNQPLGYYKQLEYTTGCMNTFRQVSGFIHSCLRVLFLIEYQQRNFTVK